MVSCWSSDGCYIIFGYCHEQGLGWGWDSSYGGKGSRTFVKGCEDASFGDHDGVGTLFFHFLLNGYNFSKYIEVNIF